MWVLVSGTSMASASREWRWWGWRGKSTAYSDQGAAGAAARPRSIGPDGEDIVDGGAALTLYMVSIPSGMMTMRLVPTKTPIPTVEIRRSWEGESDTANGSMPAPKELFHLLAFAWRHMTNRRRGRYVIAITMLKSRRVKRPSGILEVRW